MQIRHIAGYKFCQLDNLNRLQSSLLELGNDLGLKGTILLSHEGTNMNLAGSANTIDTFLSKIKTDQRFNDMSFHDTLTAEQPYRHLKVKIKDEIITIRQPDIDAVTKRAPDISANELKKWLDEGRDFTLLDTRNDYEVRFGTFKNAINLHLCHFSEFPDAIDCLDKNKPVVMFCTGGIRCEKAAIAMQQRGFEEVYQLDKGILGYFAEIGGAHYEGECFVFDERIAVNPTLETSGTKQCKECQGPVYADKPHQHI